MDTDFVDWVEDERMKRDWSKAKLARMMNVSQPYVSRVLSRLQNPGEDFIDGIVIAFGVTKESVYRHVGKLEPVGERDAWVEEIEHKFKQVPPDLRDIAIGFINQLIEREKRMKKNRRTPPMPTLPDFSDIEIPLHRYLITLLINTLITIGFFRPPEPRKLDAHWISRTYDNFY